MKDIEKPDKNDYELYEYAGDYLETDSEGNVLLLLTEKGTGNSVYGVYKLVGIIPYVE